MSFQKKSSDSCQIQREKWCSSLMHINSHRRKGTQASWLQRLTDKTLKISSHTTKLSHEIHYKMQKMLKGSSQIIFNSKNKTGCCCCPWLLPRSWRYGFIAEGTMHLGHRTQRVCTESDQNHPLWGPPFMVFQKVLSNCQGKRAVNSLTQQWLLWTTTMWLARSWILENILLQHLNKHNSKLQSKIYSCTPE